MASRAAGFAPVSRAPGSAPASGGEPQIGMIDLASDDSVRLECLRSDETNEDALLTSIAQFDALSNLVAIDDAHSAELKVFYPSFARFRQDRVQPAFDRLLADSKMRGHIFRGDDAELATALAAVGSQASREGMFYGGFRGWAGTAVGQFLAQHMPRE